MRMTSHLWKNLQHVLFQSRDNCLILMFLSWIDSRIVKFPLHHRKQPPCKSLIKGLSWTSIGFQILTSLTKTPQPHISVINHSFFLPHHMVKPTLINDRGVPRVLARDTVSHRVFELKHGETQCLSTRFNEGFWSKHV